MEDLMPERGEIPPFDKILALCANYSRRKRICAKKKYFHLAL